MTKKSTKQTTKKKRPNPYLIDDENPELTREDFRLARPAIEVLTEQFGAKAAREFIARHRGRPRKEKPKLLTSLRLDAEIIDAFRAMGKGWQSRLNAALREWLVEHG